MKLSNPVLHKKRRGPPATGKTPVTALRLPEELRRRIDAWLAAQPEPQLSLSEAIRRLVESGMSQSGTQHSRNDAFQKFHDLSETHEHEEQLRRRSLVIISADEALSHRLATIQRAMAVIYGFTIDHKATSNSQAIVQHVGIRLFNAAASGVTLALSGYYQPAFHQARDILETGFLLDLFRTAPEKISLWEKSNRSERRKHFDPVAVRKFLDDRDGDTSRKREAEYRKLSELSSHLTPRGFRLTARGQFAEFGPFLDELRLQAWLHEMVLRFGPAAVMYANHFLDAEARLILLLQEFGTALIQKYHRTPNSGGEEP